MIHCKGCMHEGCCLYFSDLNTYDISNPEEEQKAFEEFCCGCPCGDGVECNRDEGCMNYETMGEISMTVKDLKKELNKYNENFIVVIPNSEFPAGPAYEVANNVTLGINEMDNVVIIERMEEND